MSVFEPKICNSSSVFVITDMTLLTGVIDVNHTRNTCFDVLRIVLDIYVYKVSFVLY